MSMIRYEFPLNEKSRTYLRFDALFRQLSANQALANEHDSFCFFRALFDFLELAERCDVRTDLMKDLERQRQKVVTWSGLPGVDQFKLDALAEHLSRLAHELPRTPRPGSRIKEDKFLGAIRQRFAIPGGLCPFDVPVLHHWQHQSQEQRQQDAAEWLQELALLREANDLLLQLWRESGHYQSRVARGGFFQDNAEGAELIGIRLDPALGHYPTVSGHRSRFAVRFLPAGDLPTGDIPFELACC